VAKCRCGIGGKAFADLLGSCDTPEAALKKIEKGYVLGYHKAAKMAEIGIWAQMWAVTDVPPDQITPLFITPFSDLQTALDQALAQKGQKATVLFLMDGGLTVPMMH
jgi:nickel-dependent lactate racemase